MLNGTSAAPAGLAGSAAVNYDTRPDTNSRNAAGESIYVPYTAAANTAAPTAQTSSDSSFGGIMINSPPDNTNTSDAAPQSDVYSEIFPDFELPPDIETTAVTPQSISPAYIISSVWSGMTGDNGWGYLQFEVTTGSLGNPVQNATVIVTRRINNRLILTRILTTDYSGLTKTVVLPAPKYSCNNCTGNSRPFAEYRAAVYANGYYPMNNISVMIEAGIKSIQPIELIPLPERTPNPGIQPRTSE
jgi:hypothetical protein